ncbi:unnamed protein product [Caenorhabditis brenneri]
MISKPILLILAVCLAIVASQDPAEKKVQDSLKKLNEMGIDKKFTDEFYNYLKNYKAALDGTGGDPAKKKIVDEKYDKLRAELVKQLPMSKLLIVMKWAQEIIGSG